MPEQPFQPRPPSASPVRPSPDASADAPESNIERSLTGKLPCVSCGYNLQGLSVLGVCPECGTAVRATILAIIDPLAEELRPIRFPKLVAAGLLLWAAGAFVAVLLGAYATAAAIAPGSGFGFWRSHFPLWASAAVQLALVLSGVGALCMVRPHAGVGWRTIASGIVAVIAYGPLIYLSSQLLALTAAAAMAGKIDPWQDSHLTMYRLAIGGLMLAIVGGLRPAARLLVARSLALRTGRVDRQTMLAMAGSILLAMLGDILGLFGAGISGHASDVLKTAGIVLMIVGIFLLLMGIAGSLIDCVRIARSILTPGPTLRQVLDD